MKRLAVVLSLACTLGVSAQTTTPDVQPAAAGVTLTTGTQLIVVDVTVQDKNGNAIHGLKASDFKIQERKVDQLIKNFDEHTAPTSVRPVKMPVLPPGTFTDYSPAPEGSALNVLLLDELNTPLVDQSYVLSQLKKYVSQANPAANIAIFGLNSHLTILQGFTTNPAVLKYAVDHNIKLSASQLLDDASGSGMASASASSSLASVFSGGGLSAGVAVSNMAQFEGEQGSFELQYRTRATLDAFNAIAGFLSAYPGRKNLIWFSGAFPISVLPDESLADPFAVIAQNSDDIRRTTNLLDRARVAVYPVDARGVRTLPTFSASAGDSSVVSAAANGRDGYTQLKATTDFQQNDAQEHITMTRMAEDTGGRAFFNLNNLSDAVTKAVTDGANYYTITYSPLDHKYLGEFRNIRVTVDPPPNTAGPLKLSYRHGYFASNPSTKSGASTSPILSAKAADTVTAPKPALKTAVQHGAPTPSEVLFTARILPDSASSENLIARENRPNPDGKFKGPYRRYDIDVDAVTKDFSLTLAPDGHRHGEIEFVTFVYDPEGKLLNSVGKVVKLDITPETYDLLKRAGVQYRMQVSVPAQTNSLLRIAVHDIPTGKVGAIEVSTADVHSLPPAPPLAAAASAAPKP